MKAQGLGVHKPEEIEEFGKQDLKVLSELLADKPFFFGDEPTTVSRTKNLGNTSDAKVPSFRHFSSIASHSPSWPRSTTFPTRSSTP